MADIRTYPLSNEGVTEALAELDKGDGRDVAHRLAELDVKGVLDNDCACPVANYLQRALPDAEYVQVDGSAYITGIVRDDLGLSWPVVVHIDLPDSVCEFIENFDRGVYPELIEEVVLDADAAA